MAKNQIVVVGGGLAGLSAACYALASGYDVTLVEHNTALGGVCTAWSRGPYVVDGCIQWLTGGAFTRVYEELGVLPKVGLRTLSRWVRWRDVRDATTVDITSDLERLAGDLIAIGPEDHAEIARVVEGAERFGDLDPGVDRPPEITPLREQLKAFWEMRGAVGTMAHFRKPMSKWAFEHLKSPTLYRLFTRLMPADAPALMLLMVLGYLKRGWLSRPIGGSGAFRDALVATFERLGGRAILHATVDEILVDGERATGARLDDGTLLDAQAVISTSSTPETVLRLLGGRFDADATRERLEGWKLFDPIVLASFGVATKLERAPASEIVDGLEPFTIGGRPSDHLYLRVFNDEPAFAPEGHAVVQTMLPTDYAFWATRGTMYQVEKDVAAKTALSVIERVHPGLGEHVRMTDLATPLTYWRQTRSWRGAYEGWMPNGEALFGHVRKKLAGLEGLYLAGQWVEPGGGVPTAVTSGRQAVQILCSEDGRRFEPRPSEVSR